ncbi:MAG: hypothetical protein H6Q99_294 [Proteobacteria bacterium]|nr:hypothetical protein [Pseudomonadota bacterium]
MSTIIPSEIIPQLTPARKSLIRLFDDKEVLFRGRSGWGNAGSRPVHTKLVDGLIDMKLVRKYTMTRFGRSFEVARLTDLGGLVADRLRKGEKVGPQVAPDRRYGD